jgi:undecaprenyl-diphosphatase
MEILAKLQQFELRLLTKLFRQTERRAVVPLARALSRSGDGYLHLLVPLLIGALDPASFVTLFSLVALALGIERCLYWLVKNGLRRPRPQEALPGFRSLVVAGDQFSFPSGHSSAAFLLATCLFLLYGGIAVPMYLWACAVALSRVLLGVHYPGDIVAGAAMGSGIAILAAGILGMA